MAYATVLSSFLSTQTIFKPDFFEYITDTSPLLSTMPANFWNSNKNKRADMSVIRVTANVKEQHKKLDGYLSWFE
jgi:hypothetical protein